MLKVKELVAFVLYRMINEKDIFCKENLQKTYQDDITRFICYSFNILTNKMVTPLLDTLLQRAKEQGIMYKQYNPPLFKLCDLSTHFIWRSFLYTLTQCKPVRNFKNSLFFPLHYPPSMQVILLIYAVMIPFLYITQYAQDIF